MPEHYAALCIVVNETQLCKRTQEVQYVVYLYLAFHVLGL